VFSRSIRFCWRFMTPASRTRMPGMGRVSAPTVNSSVVGRFSDGSMALKAGLPDAKIVAVAPWWGDSTHPSVLDSIGSAIKDGVTAAGGTYLDIDDPLVGHSDWMANAADPNDKGYQAIAESLEPKLQPLLSQ